MRALTPDVESVLRWFTWTYRIEAIPFVGPRWVRESWPEDGGAGAQDAWLTRALEMVADTCNARLMEQQRKTTGRQKTDDRDDDGD